MAGTLNKVILIGNLGKDPEIRFLPDGSKVASFSLATGETWKDKMSGERKEKTEWHRISVFNEKLVDVLEKYVRKGSKIYLEGQMQTRKWNDQGGVERHTTEVVIGKFRGELVMLDPRKSDIEFDARSDETPKDIPIDDIPF
ncbi:MAG: single-stranded DNA-binding protein [Holosporales bacterium]|jgi:single-strand DNA-binding protein|nr:single-stranded DNA-binding protein [Holosporales bacterium]